mgnify:CR=1 FL=1
MCTGVDDDSSETARLLAWGQKVAAIRWKLEHRTMSVSRRERLIFELVQHLRGEPQRLARKALQAAVCDRREREAYIRPRRSGRRSHAAC